jgi:hypothetical protein
MNSASRDFLSSCTVMHRKHLKVRLLALIGTGRFCLDKWRRFDFVAALFILCESFFHRLHSYYLEVGKVLRVEASAASIFSSTTDIGSSREDVYRKLLKEHCLQSAISWLAASSRSRLTSSSRRILARNSPCLTKPSLASKALWHAFL